MLTLPTEIVTAKNALYTDTPFYELLEIRLLSGSILRFVNNNEDIVWPTSAGHTWTKFRFESSDDEQNANGDEHSVSVRVSNVSGLMQGHIESTSNGLIEDTVIYRYVHPDSSTVAIEEWFSIVDAVADDEWVTFTLGSENWFLNRFPGHVYRRDRCWYRPAMTDVCPYTNNSSCDRKLGTCIDLGYSSIFGGQPGIPGGVFNV